MKKLSENNFDKIFKERFNKFEVTPPDYVSRKIEQNITGKNKFKNLFNKWAVPGIAVITISTIILILSVNNNESVVNNPAIIKNTVTNNINTTTHKIIKNDNNADNNEYTDRQTTGILQAEEKQNDGNDASDKTSEIIIANAGENIKICGLSCTLKAILSNKSNTGFWQTGKSGVIFSDKNNPNTCVSVESYGQYFFVWTETNNEISSTDTVVVEFMKSGNIDIMYSVTAATCKKQNGIIKLFANTQNNYKYYWQNETTPSEPYKNNLAAGIYNIKIVDEYMCEENVSLQVKDSGIVDAKFTHLELYLNTEVPIYFSNTSTIDGSKTIQAGYLWDFGDGTTSNEENPEKTYSKQGTYSVKLTVTSPAGCTDSAILNNFKIENADIKQPNIFTPNGDGKNDIFFVKTNKLENMSGYITDRTGNIIFEWNNVENGWDGKLKNGKQAVEGLYYYFIKGIDSSGKECHINNFFYLQR